MTFTYDLNTGHLQIAFDSNNFQDAIKRITYMESLHETKCGFCESLDIRLRARTTAEKGYPYYEYICQNPECRARLQIHENQNEARTMYLKLFDNGQPLPNRGWKKWDGKRENDSGEAREAASEPRDEEVPQGRRR